MKTKPYWIVYASDYHEFDEALAHYKAAGLTVKHQEIGYSQGAYEAVFWIGKKPIEFIKACKKDVEMNTLYSQ